MKKSISASSLPKPMVRVSHDAEDQQLGQTVEMQRIREKLVSDGYIGGKAVSLNVDWRPPDWRPARSFWWHALSLHWSAKLVPAAQGVWVRALGEGRVHA